MINTDDQHFMMIEPGMRSEKPINDDVTKLAIEVAQMAKPREGHAYMGRHFCCCGQASDSQDWIMPDGRITNSLIVHYVMFHRQDIPRLELAKMFNYKIDSLKAATDKANELKSRVDKAT